MLANVLFDYRTVNRLSDCEPSDPGVRFSSRAVQAAHNKTRPDRWLKSSPARSGATLRPRWRQRRPRRLHSPDPDGRRPRADPPGQERPDADPHDSRPGLRPADRCRLREEAGVLLGRQPRCRFAAPPARRGGEGLAATAGDRGTQPRRPRQRLCRRRLRAALRGAARLRRLRPAEGQPADPQRHLPVHRRSAGGGALGASGRQRDPRAEGRPQGQRAALGHPRRAEGSGPGGEALHRHRRGDRRRTGRPDERLRPAELGAQRRVPGARRRASVLCPRLLRARQPLLPGLGPDRPRPRKLHRVDRRIHPGTEDFGAFQAKLAEGKR